MNHEHGQPAKHDKWTKCMIQPNPFANSDILPHPLPIHSQIRPYCQISAVNRNKLLYADRKPKLAVLRMILIERFYLINNVLTLLVTGDQRPSGMG